MNRIERHLNSRALRRGGSRWRFLGALVVVTAGLTASTCDWYEHPGVYYCDETNNCADVPTTVCVTKENRCRCPNPDHLYCYNRSKCMTEAECFPDMDPVCGVGGGGGDGGGGADGGAGQGGAGGG